MCDFGRLYLTLLFETPPSPIMLFPSQSELRKGFDPNGSKYWISSVSVGSGVVPPRKIELHSLEYFKYCLLGGAIACGSTHAIMTPLDLVKVRRQIDTHLYKSNMQGWKMIIKNEGFGGLLTGFGATLAGYSLQGAGNYGIYEICKYQYARLVSRETAEKYHNELYLAASATAEFVSDIILCPLEAVKVRAQATLPPHDVGFLSSFRVAIKEVGWSGLYSGLIPLWARQVPYTMTKFATFENFIHMIYQYLPKEKDQYNELAQTSISFAAGYMAGICCAIVSNPADVLVSQINKHKNPGETFIQASTRIYSKIGFVGLWNGLLTRMFMAGTLTGTQWLIYDAFKASVGLPTSG